MEKLRKFGIWVWDNKERAVLILVCLGLVYSVFRMINPPSPSDVTIPPAPRAAGTVEVPEPRMAPPEEDRPAYRRDEVLARNPFWANPRADRGEAPAEGRTQRAERDPITLERIMEMGDGSYRARLTMGRERGLVAEGDTFQGYQLLRIDGNGRTVELYNSDTGRSQILEERG